MTLNKTIEEDMPAKVEPLLLPRLDRLDMMVGHLEEIKGCNKSSGRSSSCTSIASTGTVTSDSLSSSPKKSLEKRCRPIEEVLVEIQIKGSLFDRLLQLEDRVLKLEQEIEAGRKKEEDEDEKSSGEKNTRKKSFKGLVKSCVRGRQKSKN